MITCTILKCNVWSGRLTASCLIWLLIAGPLQAGDLPRFEAAHHLQVHQVRLSTCSCRSECRWQEGSDRNRRTGDGTGLVRNPGWNRHVLAVDVPRPLNAACCDIDGDGIPEVVLAYRFESRPEESVGNVVLLKSGSDVRQPWTPREIDRVPTAHRVRWIDPQGDGNKVLLLGPMVGKRYPPQEGDHVPIYLYRPGPWKRETLSCEPAGDAPRDPSGQLGRRPSATVADGQFPGPAPLRVPRRQVGGHAPHRRRSRSLAPMRQQRSPDGPSGPATFSGRHRALARQPSRGLRAAGRAMASQGDRRPDAKRPRSGCRRPGRRRPRRDRLRVPRSRSSAVDLSGRRRRRDTLEQDGAGRRRHRRRRLPDRGFHGRRTSRYRVHWRIHPAT